MKKFIVSLLFLFAAIMFNTQPVFTQQIPGTAAVILNHYSVKNFAEGAIPRADLEIIVQAGIRSPSAVNRQPWHFTVVQTLNLAKQLVPDTVNGNVLIVVSAPGDGKTNNVQILDCALAVQSIYLAAQALGYGSHIYTGPIGNINDKFKTALSLPQGHSAIALVRVGKLQGNADAVSAASQRKKAEEVVTYK